MHYLPELPQPKNAETLLWHLAKMDGVERLHALSCPWELEAYGGSSLLEEVADRGRWAAADLKRLEEALTEEDGTPPPEQKLTTLLDIWADPEGFGEGFLSALRNYNDVFFSEEEKRIEPAIRAAGERIAERIGTVPVADLIEEISAGVRYETMPDVTELVIAPSFWVTPLLLTIVLGQRRRLLVFGARTARDSVVPGETVPTGLVQALKAISDPTRLRTLRLISRRPMGAAEISRRLRLRTPTMIHHLHALRLSGLVRIQVPEPEAKEKASYSLRPSAIKEVFEELDRFLAGAENENTERKAPAKEG
jgi:DNA-binding transcriptional ArsR family regulator